MLMMKAALIVSLTVVVWVSAINIVKDDLKYLIDWLLPIPNSEDNTNG